MVVLGIALAAVVGIWYQLEGHEVIDPPFPGLLLKARDAINAATLTNDLLTLHFDIELQDYQAMERQRDAALQKGILQLDDESWIQARIRIEGETIPVHIRLKADWVDRLEENKWPFQVRVQDEVHTERGGGHAERGGVHTERGATILGMRSFSAQSPATSGYLNEWLYMEDLRRAGILAPRYSFVNVLVNGVDWGVYALQEGISQELLESQSRRGGVFVRLDGSLFWRQRVRYDDSPAKDRNPGFDPFPLTFDLAAFVQADEFDATSVQSDPAWSEQRATALARLRDFQSNQLSAQQVFDAERMGVYIAHTNLWGARNGLEWQNDWYYYSPLTSRLEPVGHDAFSRAPDDTPFVDLAQYDDLQIVAAYAQKVSRISQPKHLEELRSAYADEFQRYYLALAQEFASMDFEAPWSRLPERQEWLWNSLHPSRTVYAYQIGGAPNSRVNVQVCNLLRYPVVLQKLKMGEREADVRAEWIEQRDGADPHDALIHPEAMPSVVLRGMQEEVPKYVTLRVPTTVLDELAPQGTSSHTTPADTEPPADVLHPLQIVTSLVGVDDQIVVDVQRDDPSALSEPVLPVQPSTEEALARHPFLRLTTDRPGFVELKPGTWHVEGDLVLPDGFGLQATQPVTLTFGRHAVFFADGPLLLLGPDKGGIHLVPKDDYWGGLVVFQADPNVTSSFYNVEIRATSGIRRDGWSTTGGVTFHESAVVFSHCRLRDSIARAAVHIVHSNFEIAHTEFENLAFDALDGDFAQGRIEQSTFHNVRGNGINVSGSRIGIQDVSLSRIYGEGISAGQSSVVIMSNVRLADAYIGTASKDMSSVRAQGVHVARAWAAGFAAYQEELEYGTASIQASGVVFEDDSIQAMVQEKSSIVINGTPAIASKLDVAELYRRQSVLGAMRGLNYYFGSDIRLLGYELTTPEPSPGGTLALTLYWQSRVRPDRDYTVFVHVLDASGQTVVGWDDMPGQNAFPTTRWRVGRLVDDTHVVPLPADLPAGEYWIALGLYFLQTGERLPIRGPEGEDIPDARIILEEVVKVG